MSIGQIIKKKRELLGMTMDEVCENAGFSKPYLSTIENDKVKNPPSDEILLKLERILEFESGLLVHIAHTERMTPDIRREYEAAEEENKKLRNIIKHIINNEINTDDIAKQLQEDDIDLGVSDLSYCAEKFIPVINRIGDGYPTECNYLNFPLVAKEYIKCPDLHDARAFAIRVFGDYMETKYSKDDIVIFSPVEKVEEGSDCFVILGEKNSMHFKRIFFESDNMVRLQPRNEEYKPILEERKNITGIYRAVMRCKRV